MIIGAVALTTALAALTLVFVFECDIPYVKWGSARRRTAVYSLTKLYCILPPNKYFV